MSSSSNKRVKLSGAAYRWQREERREAIKRSASRIQRFCVLVEDVPTINSIKEIPIGPNQDDTASSLPVQGAIDGASFSEESDSLVESDVGAAETHIGEVDSDISSMMLEFGTYHCRTLFGSKSYPVDQ